jgi:2-oxoisovalerate dehydrogenase E1 component alpha subunit
MAPTKRRVASPVTNNVHAAPRRKAEHERLGLSAERLLEMYRTMLLARLVDERQWILNRQGRQAFHISCQGHEGSGVGSAFALDRERDVMLPYYRSLAAVLAFGMSARDQFLAGLARAEDPASGARQMPAHYGLAPHILTSGSPVATQIPHAAGAALANKIRDNGGVAITYFGDGASSKGDFHEGINFAAIHRLPAIFVCENNHYAISVPTEKQMAIRSVADRGPGYGLPSVSIDGTDALAVYRVVREAADRARAGEGPTLIESNVVRLTPHSSDDDDRRYRPESDREAARQQDPITRFEQYLREQDVLNDSLASETRQAVQDEVAQALEDAEAAPGPDPSTAFDHVYEGLRVPALRR